MRFMKIDKMVLRDIIMIEFNSLWPILTDISLNRLSIFYGYFKPYDKTLMKLAVVSFVTPQRGRS
jgi:hypothetical protein